MAGAALAGSMTRAALGDSTATARAASSLCSGISATTLTSSCGCGAAAARTLIRCTGAAASGRPVQAVDLWRRFGTRASSPTVAWSDAASSRARAWFSSEINMSTGGVSGVSTASASDLYTASASGRCAASATPQPETRPPATRSWLLLRGRRAQTPRWRLPPRLRKASGSQSLLRPQTRPASRAAASRRDKPSARRRVVRFSFRSDRRQRLDAQLPPRWRPVPACRSQLPLQSRREAASRPRLPLRGDRCNPSMMASVLVATATTSGGV